MRRNCGILMAAVFLVIIFLQQQTQISDFSLDDFFFIKKKWHVAGAGLRPQAGRQGRQRRQEGQDISTTWFVPMCCWIGASE